jgi:hypothetical protein
MIAGVKTSQDRWEGLGCHYLCTATQHLPVTGEQLASKHELTN